MSKMVLRPVHHTKNRPPTPRIAFRYLHFEDDIEYQFEVKMTEFEVKRTFNAET